MRVERVLRRGVHLTRVERALRRCNRLWSTRSRMAIPDSAEQWERHRDKHWETDTFHLAPALLASAGAELSSIKVQSLRDRSGDRRTMVLHATRECHRRLNGFSVSRASACAHNPVQLEAWVWRRTFDGAILFLLVRLKVKVVLSKMGLPSFVESNVCSALRCTGCDWSVVTPVAAGYTLELPAGRGALLAGSWTDAACGQRQLSSNKLKYPPTHTFRGKS